MSENLDQAWHLVLCGVGVHWHCAVLSPVVRCFYPDSVTVTAASLVWVKINYLPLARPCPVQQHSWVISLQHITWTNIHQLDRVETNYKAVPSIADIITTGWFPLWSSKCCKCTILNSFCLVDEWMFLYTEIIMSDITSAPFLSELRHQELNLKIWSGRNRVQT